MRIESLEIPHESLGMLIFDILILLSKHLLFQLEGPSWIADKDKDSEQKIKFIQMITDSPETVVKKQ